MINVLLCGNIGVYDGMMTCALSIFKRTKTKEPIFFHILTASLTHIKKEYEAISEKDADYLDRVAKEYNPKNRVKLTDVTNLYTAEFSGCPNEGAYCSPYTLLRLLADLIPDMPDKLLYLDTDVLFNKAIELLYGFDVEAYEYAAAKDHYGRLFISPGYINAGVLLLNMKEIRKSGLFSRARGLIRKRRLTFADQSAIIRCTQRRALLPQRFNDQRLLRRDTVIRHFSRRLYYLPYPHTGNIKPWQVSLVHKVLGYYCFDDILYEYIYHIETKRRMGHE